jgi:hypothetical protein
MIENVRVSDETKAGEVEASGLERRGRELRVTCVAINIGDPEREFN